MKWKTLTIFTMLMLGLYLNFLPQTKAEVTTVTDAYLSLNTGDSLGIGVHTTYYILITVTSGSINSTTINYEVDTYRGLFIFNSNASGTLLFTDPEQDYDLRAEGGTYTKDETTGYINLAFLAGSTITLVWETTLVPILPFMFILGMVGMASMFGGIMLMAHEIKQHEYYDSVAVGFVIAIIGTCLMIAWLWSF